MSEVINELLSAEVELEASHSYVELEDDELFHKIAYWKGEVDNPQRSERSRKLAKVVLERVAFEIRTRHAEELALEAHLEAEAGEVTE